MDMFYQEESGHMLSGPALPSPRCLHAPSICGLDLSGELGSSDSPRTSLTYEQVVRNLMHEERQYLRDLHLIVNVFREELGKLVTDNGVGF